MIRFFVFLSMLLLLILYLFVFLVENIILFVFFLILTILALPFLIALVHFCTLPIENQIKKNYIKKASKVLHDFKGKTIAITGSFGKTSVKNILYEILKGDKKVVITPENFNTPMGICRTVFEYLEKDSEILILEMGARQSGDIKELVQMCDPDICILTGVGEQHIETFGNLEKIISTKNEIVTFSRPSAKIYFNGACQNVNLLFQKCSKTKILVNGKNSTTTFSNVKYEKSGMSFDLKHGSKIKRIQTKLLGEFNCENITLAVCVCIDLGLDFGVICERLKSLKPVKNRLELIEFRDFVIIDDSYNANIKGCAESLKVLKNFDQEKIIITSGIVELGSVQYEKNFLLGKQIAKVCDKVLIMNETNKTAIKNGLDSQKFNTEKVFFATSRKEQVDWLSKHAKNSCVVLFQNDLPDNYK